MLISNGFQLTSLPRSLTGDISGQSEPLLSSLDDESSSIVQLHHQTPGSGGHDEEDESLTISNGAPPDTPLLISYQVSCALCRL